MSKKEKELQAKEAELNKRERVCAFVIETWNHAIPVCPVFDQTMCLRIHGGLLLHSIFQ
jgi:hypothetical protein